MAARTLLAAAARSRGRAALWRLIAPCSQVLARPVCVRRRIVTVEVLGDVRFNDRAQFGRILRLQAGEHAARLRGDDLVEQPDCQGARCQADGPASAPARRAAAFRSASGVSLRPASAAKATRIAVSSAGT